MAGLAVDRVAGLCDGSVWGKGHPAPRLLALQPRPPAPHAPGRRRLLSHADDDSLLLVMVSGMVGQSCPL